MMTILLVTLIGAIVSLIVGSIWYSDKTPMGRLHMHYLGFDKLNPDEQKKLIDEAKPHMWKSFLGQFFLSGFTAFFVALVSVTSAQNGVPMSMIVGFVLLPWICFIIPVVGSTIIWGNVDRKIAWKKFFADSLSYLVTMLIVLFIAILFI